MQGRTRNITFHTKRVDNGIRRTIDRERTATTEIHPPSKTIGTESDIDRTARNRRIGTIGSRRIHGQRCAASGCHHRIDVDVIGRRQRQGIGAPAHRVVDIDVA